MAMERKYPGFERRARRRDEPLPGRGEVQRWDLEKVVDARGEHPRRDDVRTAKDRFDVVETFFIERVQ